MPDITVARMREIIATAPDDALLVVPSHDHGYRPASVEVTTALQEGRRSWTEDHGEDVTPEAEYGKRVQVVVIS